MTKRAFAAIDKYCLSLPGAEMVIQWGHRVYKVGGKVFALLSDGGDAGPPGLGFKVDETTFTILTRLNGIEQAPYFAKRQWVHMEPLEVLPLAEVKAYIKRSYDAITAKLTRKQRAALRIDA